MSEAQAGVKRVKFFEEVICPDQEYVINVAFDEEWRSFKYLLSITDIYMLAIVGENGAPMAVPLIC